MTMMWIDADANFETAVGDVGFLVQRYHNIKGWDRYTLEPDPAHGNQEKWLARACAETGK
jgi:hypothetical protein